MADNGERQRRRNAKRWLWAILAASVALAALIAYTSFRAPEPGVRPSEAPMAPPDREPMPAPAEGAEPDHQ